MPRLLALEWDEREVRVAVGRTSVGELTVDKAFAIELEGQPLPERLAAALSEHGVSRSETLVAVQRARAELRLLATPPVPDEELPGLVRFQAMRQFSNMAEDWLFDYVPLSSVTGEEEQIQVLAAAVSPDIVRTVQETCVQGASPPRRIVLRPYASASLLNRRLPAEGCRLFVELMNTEAELTMLDGREAVLIRSVRMPTENVGMVLAGEIRRTIAAAQNQLGPRSVDAIVLCGDEGEYAELIGDLCDRLELPIAAFDPFEGASLGSDLRRELPLHRGRYASVLGMLYDEAEGGRHMLDFLNPRRPPAPPNFRMRVAVLGGIAALAVLMLIMLLVSKFNALDRRIESLRAESKGWDEQLTAVADLQADVAQVDAFVAGDITWLNELCYISEKLPPPEDVIVDQATFSTQLNGGGQILLEGNVRTSEVIESMENDLRDDVHQVTGSGGQYDDRQQTYPWRFKERIDVPASQIEEGTIDE